MSDEKTIGNGNNSFKDPPPAWAIVPQALLHPITQSLANWNSETDREQLQEFYGSNDGLDAARRSS